MLLRVGSDFGSWSSHQRYASVGAIGTAAVGMLKTSPQWRAVLDHYRDDRLDEARSLASQGIGDAGIYADVHAAIEAEWRTGRHSEIFRASDWLEVEAVGSELPCTLSQLAAIAQSTLRRVFGELRLPSGGDVLVTVLSREVLPPAPYAEVGYVALKAPFAKLCISPEASGGTPDLERAIGALGACCAAGLISEAGAAPWVYAAAMAAAGERVNTDTQRAFCAGELPWLKPEDLSSRLIGQSSVKLRMPPFQVARAQALLVGDRIIEKVGIDGMRRILSFHAPHPFTHGLRLIFTGNPTKAACKATYGFAPEKLFEEALASVCGR